MPKKKKRKERKRKETREARSLDEWGTKKMDIRVSKRKGKRTMKMNERKRKYI